MMLQSQPQPPSTHIKTERLAPRKRKADSQDNERLSKRLGQLNLERNGSKLYVPVETPTPDTTLKLNGPQTSQSSNDFMQLDDSKHKIYIHNIDDELSSDESDSEPGKLIFLPDIEKRLRATRIPPPILANKDGELAGMQMVLYHDPKSLTVPEEHDAVRKAIIETRRWARERQEQQKQEKLVYSLKPEPERNAEDDMIVEVGSDEEHSLEDMDID